MVSSEGLFNKGGLLESLATVNASH